MRKDLPLPSRLALACPGWGLSGWGTTTHGSKILGLIQPWEISGYGCWPLVRFNPQAGEGQRAEARDVAVVEQAALADGRRGWCEAEPCLGA